MVLSTLFRLVMLTRPEDSVWLRPRPQVDISADLIQDYQQRRQTIAEHQPQIVDYLGLRRFGETWTCSDDIGSGA